MPTETHEPPFWEAMLANFTLARSSVPEGHKSSHWDVFPDDYERVLAERAAWESFLRNGISVGFNDDLMVVPDRWEYRKRHDFRPLLPETVTDSDRCELFRRSAALLLGQCGYKALKRLVAPGIGSPASVTLRLGLDDGGEDAVTTSIHDLRLVYYAWQIGRVGRLLPEGPRLVVDIGGGYGELPAKLKTIWPDARLVLFDLPESNAVQTYYLARRFPGARFLYLSDLEARGGAIFDEPFDFCILPGWTMDRLPDRSAAVVINTRSFQEMRRAVIEYYFGQIHRVIRERGVFYNVNRLSGTLDGEEYAFRHYPYDDCWRLIIGQGNPMQPQLHEALTWRTAAPEPYPVTEAFRSLGVDLRLLVQP